MTKLCARGKAAAKRKFKVYPSAYANAYASKICAGKAKDPSGLKRKDWGPKKANKGLAVETLKEDVQKIIDSFPKEKKYNYKKPKKKPYKIVKPDRAMSIDTTTSAYGDSGKGRKVPEFSKGGGAAIRGMGFKGVF
jgi:hypothetical protein